MPAKTRARGLCDSDSAPNPLTKMFIQTEATPNPQTWKFLPGCPVLADPPAGFSADFIRTDTPAPSPLARRLFAIAEVERVYFGADFVSVTASPTTNWELLKPAVLGAVMEHFVSGAELLDETAAHPAPQEPTADPTTQDDSPVAQEIRRLLDSHVRPAVAQDGGDITFHGFENGVVYLHLRGACAGCPSSTATLKMGIERLLRHQIPEVTEVRALA